MSSSGIGKFESLTIFVVIIALLAGGFYLILNMSKGTKYKSMQQSALKLVGVSSSSDTAFLTYRDYYLQEAFDEEIIKSMKSPFSAGDCDVNESKVTFDAENNVYYVTLKCGEYLINNMKSTDTNYTVYKVSEWSDTKVNDDDQTRTAFSCNGCGVEGEYEEALFVYLYNKNNGTSYNTLGEITDGSISNKTQYRTKEVVFEK